MTNSFQQDKTKCNFFLLYAFLFRCKKCGSWMSPFWSTIARLNIDVKNSFFYFMPYECYLKSFFEPHLSTHDWTSQLTFCQTKPFVHTLIKAAMLYWNGTTTIATFLMPHAPKSSTSLPSLKIPLFYLKPIFFDVKNTK